MGGKRGGVGGNRVEEARAERDWRVATRPSLRAGLSFPRRSSAVTWAAGAEHAGGSLYQREGQRREGPGGGMAAAGKMGGGRRRAGRALLKAGRPSMARYSLFSAPESSRSRIFFSAALTTWGGGDVARGAGIEQRLVVGGEVRERGREARRRRDRSGGGGGGGVAGACGGAAGCGRRGGLCGGKVTPQEKGGKRGRAARASRTMGLRLSSRYAPTPRFSFFGASHALNASLTP